MGVGVVVGAGVVVQSILRVVVVAGVVVMLLSSSCPNGKRLKEK